MSDKKGEKRKKSRQQLTEFEKGQIIGWNTEGVSSRNIAKRLKRGKSCVQAVINRFKSTGDTSRLPGNGRKRKTTVRDDRYIVRQALKKRRISSGRFLRKYHGLHIT